MKNTLYFIGYVVLFALAFLNSLLLIHIIRSLDGLYGLGLSELFTVGQMYAAVLITNLIRFKYKKDEDKPRDEVLKNAYYSLVTYAVTYLFGWGLGYLAHFAF